MQHYDWDGTQFRIEASKLILQRLKSATDSDTGASSRSLIFLIGDFNQHDTDPAYSLITGGRYITSTIAAASENTFFDLRKEYSDDQSTPTWVEYSTGTPSFPPMIIDYIFAADNGAFTGAEASWKVEGVKVVDNEFGIEGENGKYKYSDHRMLIASLSAVK